MIVQPTTLVLGAGASMDFQFPSGWRLMREVAQLDQGGHAGAAIRLGEMGYTARQIDDFCDSLKNSGAMSVDVFLGDRLDLVDIGKKAIAAALIPYENGSNVHALGDQPSWLHRLFEALRAPSDRWGENKLSIVTFNYDRAVEFFLHKALMKSFQLSSADAGQLLCSTIQIVHVHGQLGYLPDIGDGPRHPFEPAATADRIRIAASRIRIMHEGSDNDDDVIKARMLIANAQHVAFLGFGFSAANMARLSLDTMLRGKNATASCFGMRRQQINDAVTRSAGNLSFVPPELKLAELLQDYAIFGKLA